MDEKDRDYGVEFVDKHGQPIDQQKFMELFEDRDYRIVSNTQVAGITVSTVWLGINHSFGNRNPIIFETMVFDNREHDLKSPPENPFDYDDLNRRYATLGEALTGHRKIAQRIMAEEMGLPPSKLPKVD